MNSKMTPLISPLNSPQYSPSFSPNLSPLNSPLNSPMTNIYFNDSLFESSRHMLARNQLIISLVLQSHIRLKSSKALLFKHKLREGHTQLTVLFELNDPLNK